MIAGRIAEGAQAFAQRLAAQAALIAEARARERRISPARRWRDPALLWPLFGREPR